MSEKSNGEGIRRSILGSITDALVRIEKSDNLNSEIASDLNHIYTMAEKAIAPPTDTCSNVHESKKVGLGTTEVVGESKKVGLGAAKEVSASVIENILKDVNELKACSTAIETDIGYIMVAVSDIKDIKHEIDIMNKKINKVIKDTEELKSYVYNEINPNSEAMGADINDIEYEIGIMNKKIDEVLSIVSHMEHFHCKDSGSKDSENKDSGVKVTFF